MDCIEIKKLLPLFMERKLGEEERKSVEEHLLECRNCAFESALFEKIENTLESAERVKAPDYLKERILSNIFPAFEPAKERRQLGILSIAAAIISIAAILVYFPFNKIDTGLLNQLSIFQKDVIFDIEYMLTNFQETLICISEFSFQTLMIFCFIMFSVIFFVYEYITSQNGIRVKQKNQQF